MQKQNAVIHEKHHVKGPEQAPCFSLRTLQHVTRRETSSDPHWMRTLKHNVVYVNVGWSLKTREIKQQASGLISVMENFMHILQSGVV